MSLTFHIFWTSCSNDQSSPLFYILIFTAVGSHSVGYLLLCKIFSMHYLVPMISMLHIQKVYIHLIFSSPELFWSPVVCLSVHPSVHPSVCKLFLFSLSSQEPLGKFQPNLAQSILGWWIFRFVQMKGPTLFQGEIIRK